MSTEQVSAGTTDTVSASASGFGISYAITSTSMRYSSFGKKAAKPYTTG